MKEKSGIKQFKVNSAKWVLDRMASLISKSPDALFYLVSGPLKDKIEAAVNRSNAYKHIEVSCEIVKSKLKSDFCIVDVGGGQGVTAEIFSRFFPKNQIHIFEPISGNVDIIKKKAEKFANWKIHPYALGDSYSKSVINVNARVTSSSILKSDMGSLHDSALETLHQQEIEIQKLDDYLNNESPIGILKMDVQGYEMMVLKGAVDKLKDCFLVVLEINNHGGYSGSPEYFELDAFLRDQGFRIHNIFPSMSEEFKHLEWDAIYVKQA